MVDCPSCGVVAARPDQRYCARCGTTLVPAEPPTAYDRGTRISGPLYADEPPPAYPPPPVPASDDRSARRRASVVLLAAAAVVAALIGAGGAVLLLGEADAPAEAEERDGAAGSTTEADRSRAPSVGPGTAATTAPEQFRCWNGDAPVERLLDCPPPTGPEGMAWVFPSVSDQSCTFTAGAALRVTEADCDVELMEGGEVRFHYSEWRSRAALESYYGSNKIRDVGLLMSNKDLVVVQVRSRDEAVDHKAAIYYADPSAVWSVTIYADDQATFFAAEGHLEARRLLELRGERG